MAEIKKYFDPMGNELIPVYNDSTKQIYEGIGAGGMIGRHDGYTAIPEVYDEILSHTPINETIIDINDINTNKQVIIFENMEIGYNKDDETDILKQSFYFNLVTSNDKLYGGTDINIHFSNNQNESISTEYYGHMGIGTKFGTVRLHYITYGIINLDSDNNILNYYYII